MTQTNTQRKKQQKKKARENRIKKNRNMAKNLAPPRWRLDVLYQSAWRVGIRQFRSWSSVERHEKETEELRKNGTEIFAGRIVDLLVGNVVKEIAPSPPKVKGKGALPDKLADEPELAKKGLFGFLKK